VGASDSEKLDLFKEAILLNSLNHPNLIQLHGVCCSADNELNPKYLIFEYMNMGDLLGYLRLLKADNKNLSKSDAIQVIIEIAKGAAYLEKLKMIHR
jgi:serine/threonine protein kinase